MGVVKGGAGCGGCGPTMQLAVLYPKCASLTGTAHTYLEPLQLVQG